MTLVSTPQRYFTFKRDADGDVKIAVMNDHGDRIFAEALTDSTWRGFLATFAKERLFGARTPTGLFALSRDPGPIDQVELVAYDETGEDFVRREFMPRATWEEIVTQLETGKDDRSA